MAYSGKYTPKNPQKYKGNPNNIIWRSTWELRMLKFLDSNPSIIEWGSEEVVIPYVSPLDNKVHRYFVDFYVKVRSKSGTINKFLIEVKPFNQTIPPKKPKRLTESYRSSVATYLVNGAKWEAAKRWAEERGMSFFIFTENELFNK
jgi:hypothetical protein